MNMGDEHDWLGKAITVVLAAAASFMGLVFVTGGWKRETELKMADLAKDNEDRKRFCSRQKEEIVTTLTVTLCASMREMLRAEQRQGDKDISEINKNIALLTQSQHTMQRDIEEIFARLNKRQPPDTGDRRRATDT